MKNRIACLGIIAATIVLGLLSRRLSFVPAATGDALYALMMYFIMRLIFLHKRSIAIAAISLSICFAIEFSQCYRAPWINALRSTLPGRLVLGQGFLWSDLLAYCAGVLAGVAIEKLLHKKD
ncbi:ribosomal maturation YjgA family protein [Taibaiella koreensis]|uniref:ribosomal maturation YjgA family protein n=1 Tax=Taibaiella koreensis TaxID=1268548 RepID=UPI000E5A0D02|nr:DUF2809 domain-containing protein [Taibaiella koreensis]